MRSTSSSPMPSTAAEAMARAQLLLRFPPAAEQMDEWRATIQSLLDFAEGWGSQRAGPPWPPQAMTTARAAGRTKGATPTVQSPQRQPARAQQNQDPDDVSMASSDPRARPGQRRAPKDRRRGDTRIVVEQRRDAPRRTDGCDGPDVDEPALGVGGCLPFEVGCCNAPDTPAGGRYSWRDLDWPQRSILVFSAHFVLTRARPGATSRSVTHPDTTPS